MSMSRLMAAKLRNSVPMPPKPPASETAAASSADVQVPIGAKMIGTSMSNREQSGVVSMVSSPTHPLGTRDRHYDNRAASRHLRTPHHNRLLRVCSRIRGSAPRIRIPLAEEDVVGHRVPGIVDADEEQQQASGGNPKQSLAREQNGRRRRYGQHGVGCHRQGDVKQPVL